MHAAAAAAAVAMSCSSSNASSSSPATRSGSRGIELAAAEDSAAKAALLKLARDPSLTAVTQSVLSQWPIVTNGLISAAAAPADMSGPVFVAMVNPKSGGNVGTQLLARFKEILDDDRVYNLGEEDQGPVKGLEDHRDTDNLRIIGKITTSTKNGNSSIAPQRGEAFMRTN